MMHAIERAEVGRNHSFFGTLLGRSTQLASVLMLAEMLCRCSGQPRQIEHGAALLLVPSAAF